MITILLGAGASYGSDSSGTPPLGPQLFDELKKFAASTWGAISGDIEDVFRTDFEEGMRLLIDRSKFAAPLQWDMAEYFYRSFRIRASNKYLELLDEIRGSSVKIALSTLNYDTLLFQAAQHLDTPLSIGSTPPISQGFSLTLPHGSSTLYCSSLKATGNIAFQGRIASSGKVKVFRDLQEFYSEKQSNRFPPVMSYFEPNKFTPSGASFIKKQRELFLDHVINSEGIVIIGVNVHPIDVHIWEPLLRTKAKIMYIGGQLGKTSFEQWATDNSRKGCIILDKYFDDCIDDVKTFLDMKGA